MLTGTLPASSLTGVLPAGLVPTLDATKIASGIFDSSRVPALDAAKIASGTLGDARLSANIPLLSMSAFFTADLGAARLKAGADGVLTGTLSSIGGGFLNTNNADYSTIAGGNKNLIGAGATYSAVGGGQNNLITSNALRSVIPGGSRNVVAGVNSFAAGVNARALHDYSFVWNDAAGGDLTSTANNEFSLRGTSGIRFFTGNPANFTVNGLPVLAGTIDASKVSGGQLQVGSLNSGESNVRNGTRNSITGGYLNVNSADDSILGGGNQNTITSGSLYSVLGGGQNNLITSNALWSVIPGGSGNVVAGVNSFAAGIRAKALHDYSFVWNDAAGTDLATTDTHQFRVRSVNGIFFETGNKGMTVDGKRVLAGTISATNIVSGLLAVPQLKIGTSHNLGGDLSTITGGDSNSTESDYAVIAGGIFNMVQANSIFSSIGGGKDNKILSGAGVGTIGGGLLNIIGTNSFESTVGGGRQNEIGSSAGGSVISGGAYNRLRSNAYHGVISGGIANTLEANAGLGTIGGGGNNTVTPGSV